jgi:hypothetical protein
MSNPIGPLDEGMADRIRAVAERDRENRRRAGFDPNVRVSFVRPWSLKEQTR